MSEYVLERAKAERKARESGAMWSEDTESLYDELIAEVEANQILLRQFQVHEDQNHAAMEGLLGNSDNFIELAREMKEEVWRLRSQSVEQVFRRSKGLLPQSHQRARGGDEECGCKT